MEDDFPICGCIGRRNFLGAGGALLIGATPFSRALAEVGRPERRWLDLVNIRTRERLKIIYFADGGYVRGALGRINEFMRDPWDKSLTGMDPALIDMVHELQVALGLEEPLHMLSAYRSPESNAKARRRLGRKVAKDSFHVHGRAIDLRLPNRDLGSLIRAARRVGQGGIGVYTRSRSRHVHLDTGPERSWRG